MDKTFTPIKICEEHKDCDNNCQKLYTSLVEPQKLVENAPPKLVENKTQKLVENKTQKMIENAPPKLVNVPKNNEKCDIDTIQKHREILDVADNFETVNLQEFEQFEPKLHMNSIVGYKKAQAIDEKSFGDEMREIAKDKLVSKIMNHIRKHAKHGKYICYYDMNSKFAKTNLQVLNDEFVNDGIIFKFVKTHDYGMITTILIDWSPKNKIDLAENETNLTENN